MFPDHNIQGTDLYYLGWCHGPAGTSRLFFQLWEITRNQQWMDIVEDSAWSTIVSDVPMRPNVPGFWNNLGQCCGDASIVEFYLNLYRATNKELYLKRALEVTDHLINRIEQVPTTEGIGVFWRHAENRVSTIDFAQVLTDRADN